MWQPEGNEVPRLQSTAQQVKRACLSAQHTHPLTCVADIGLVSVDDFQAPSDPHVLCPLTKLLQQAVIHVKQLRVWGFADLIEGIKHQ